MCYVLKANAERTTQFTFCTPNQRGWEQRLFYPSTAFITLGGNRKRQALVLALKTQKINQLIHCLLQ